MITDRYGKTISPKNSIVVFDTSLNYDSELFEDPIGWRLRDVDRSRYSSAYEADFGAGADWPAVAYEVLDRYVPFSAVAAAFFLGDRIEKSMMAWKRMAASLLSCIPRGGFTDANGAALLALERVFERDQNTDVKLLAYTWVDGVVISSDAKERANLAFDIIEKLDEIEPRENQFGIGLHSHPIFLFKFQTGEDQLLVAVRKKEVWCSELEGESRSKTRS